MKWEGDDAPRGTKSIFRGPDAWDARGNRPDVTAGGRAPAERDETIADYAAFTTLTLQATLVSLKVTMAIRGPNEKMRKTKRRLESELARRGEVT